MRILVVPNLKLFENVIRPVLEGDEDISKKQEAGMVLKAIINVLKLLEEDVVLNGNVTDNEKDRLKQKVGELVAGEVWKERREVLVRGILDA